MYHTIIPFIVTLLRFWWKCILFSVVDGEKYPLTATLIFHRGLYHVDVVFGILIPFLSCFYLGQRTCPPFPFNIIYKHNRAYFNLVSMEENSYLMFFQCIFFSIFSRFTRSFIIFCVELSRCLIHSSFRDRVNFFVQNFFTHPQ